MVSASLRRAHDAGPASRPRAAGLYAAAWTLGGLYVNIILQAMGADFYPRLVGVAEHDAEVNRLTNEQIKVSMLLAVPGVCATIVFAPLVIALFYSHEFAGAIPTLRWICLGVALRVITWPMGFIIIAKGQRKLFLGVDMAWTVLNVALTWLFIEWVGLDGAGLAFFASYLFHALIIYPIAFRLTGFSLSKDNLRVGLTLLSSIFFAFFACVFFPVPISEIFGALIIIVSSIYSVYSLITLLEDGKLPPQIRKILKKLPISRWNPA